MPVIIDEMSAEIQPGPAQAEAPAAPATTEPGPAAQLDTLRRRLRQLEARRTRLKAD